MSRVARTVLGIGSPLLVVAMLVDAPVGEWLFVVVSLSFPAALLALGLDRLRPSRWHPALVLTLGLLLEAGGVGMLALRGSPKSGPPFGLPPGGTLMLLLLGVGPLLLVAVGYAALRRHRPDDASDGGP